MMAIASLRMIVIVWVQRPAKCSQLPLRQILEVDPKGEFNSRFQRFEACVLSILWIYFSRFLDCSTNLLRLESVVGSQTLMPVEFMAAYGGFVTVRWSIIVMIKVSLIIRMLLCKILLEFGRLWVSQDSWGYFLVKSSR